VKTPAVGDGPIGFVGNDGRQWSIPLSALHFEGSGITSDIAVNGLQTWLDYLVAQGRLVPGAEPAAPDAIVFTAVAPGSVGNDVVITVRAVGTSAVEITVTETHLYQSLTLTSGDPRFIQTLLGPSSGGLVKVQALAVPLSPPAAVTLPATGPLLVSGTAASPIWTIKAPPGGPAAVTLATLEARGSGVEKGSMITLIDNVDTSAGTFTLTTKWTSNALTVQAADLQVLSPPTASSAFSDLGFSVTVSAPKVGGLTLPKPGTFALQGGADWVPAQLAKPASATLPADE
jgi:hypothetical protein